MASVTLTAIAVLEGARSVENKPKSLIFDAHLWLGSEGSLIAGLRYFNSFDYAFKDVNTCLIVASVVKCTSELYTLLESELDVKDYDLFGDIIHLIPLPQDTDARHLAFVHVSGTSSHADASEFTMEPNLRLPHVPAGNPPLCFPMTGIIPDSSRWSGKKPVPAANTIASVNGWLTGTQGRTENGAVERFVVKVENVAFLGRATVPPRTPTSGRKKDSPKKLKFSFDSVQDQGSPSKKRRTGDDAEARKQPE